MTHYDVYGRMAVADLSETTQNGRYPAQQAGEKLVPKDVMAKLEINAEDSFLDIGCGLGLNLEPISKIARVCAACDHPNVIAKLKEKRGEIKADLYSGNFLELDFDRTYTKILAYSVLPALPDKEALYAFVEKALSLLDTKGRMLLGDLGNSDKKKRFLNSERGKAFQAEWERLCREQNAGEDAAGFQTEDDGAVAIDDRFILDLMAFIRTKGFDAYLFDQPSNLPFGNTREDLLVVGPEYERTLS